VFQGVVWHPSVGMDTFETPRLTAERLRSDHFADMAALHLDPEVSRYLSGVRPPDETEIYMATKLAHWEQHGFGLWVLRTRDGEFAGRAGIQHVVFDGVPEVDVAYTFRRAVWGQGLATEITLALVDIGLGQLNLPSLIGFASARNAASLRVLEKSGFGFERRTTFKDDEVVVYRHWGRSQPVP
jgi:RimJ/RimL family protein N-acetyltransferase